MAGKLGGGGGRKGMSPNSEPNVIPFIDIMLVVLIIFMVAAPLPTVDIKVDLPPPGNVVYVKPEDSPTVVKLVEVAGAQQIFIGDKLVDKAAFDRELMFIASQNNPSYRASLAELFEKAKVFVDADKETQYFNVIQLINDIDTVGFKSVSLLVKEDQS
jgi:biopolymer transport protein ExbD